MALIVTHSKGFRISTTNDLYRKSLFHRKPRRAGRTTTWEPYGHEVDPPSQSVSDLVKRMKGRSSRLLQQEYPELQKRYWGRHFWAIGYGAWSTGNLTDELVAEYLEHHRNPSNQERDNFLLE